jgi:hypothetical protein
MKRLILLVIAGLLIMFGGTWFDGHGGKALKVPEAKAMCASISAACGGYPAPPTCSWWNNGSYWYGHWWSVYYGYPYVYNYHAGNFLCTNNFPWAYNSFVQGGVDPHASPGYAWMG